MNNQRLENLNSKLSFKEKVYSYCLQLLEAKINQLRNNLLELKEGTESDSKSSAGDKHETSRAMMQIEYEKISRLLDEFQRQINELEKIDIHSVSGKIKSGSFIKTNVGYLFFGAAIGKINVDEIAVMVISLQSPIGLKLSGQKAGDRIEMNGLEYIIEKID